MMNYKLFRKERQPCTVLEGLRKCMETSLRTSGVWTLIRTKQLSNRGPLHQSARSEFLRLDNNLYALQHWSRISLLDFGFSGNDYEEYGRLGCNALYSERDIRLCFSLAWLTPLDWRWRWYVPPNGRPVSEQHIFTSLFLRDFPVTCYYMFETYLIVLLEISYWVTYFNPRPRYQEYKLGDSRLNLLMLLYHHTCMY
jgi:hypothetical protein